MQFHCLTSCLGQSFLSTSTLLGAVEMNCGAAARTRSIVRSSHDQLQQPWHGRDTLQMCSLKQRVE